MLAVQSATGTRGVVFEVQGLRRHPPLYEVSIRDDQMSLVEAVCRDHFIMRFVSTTGRSPHCGMTSSVMCLEMLHMGCHDLSSKRLLPPSHVQPELSSKLRSH